jgi:hypothetical protein
VAPWSNIASNNIAPEKPTKSFEMNFKQHIVKFSSLILRTKTGRETKSEHPARLPALKTTEH